jgi:multiple sugar transport system ATP-binding protein
MAEILIKGVAKSFGSFTALHSIDLTIADQEFMVLLGASGCGKTTLLRIIAGLESPTQGEVWIGGKRVDQLPPRERGIAMVFQNYAVFPHLTVYENIAFGLRMKKLPQAEVDTRVKRTAELMHIEQLLKRYSGQLSGGQRQRVAVARALAMEPDVILMDEPLSNLDALLRLEMRAELKGVLANSKTTTIYVTHDQVEAMSLADRISVMNGGHIVQAASPVGSLPQPRRPLRRQLHRQPADEFPAGAAERRRPLPGGRHRPRGSVAAAASARIRHPPRGSHHRAGGLKATARVIEPLGAHTLVTSEVDGKLFRAVLDSDLKVAPGDELSLVPKPDRVRWFDPETSHGQLMPSTDANDFRSALADQGHRGAARERPRQLHGADQGALSVPVELGFLLHRARPEPLRHGPRLDRGGDAVRPPMGRRHGAAHGVPRAGADGYFPGPDVWGTGRTPPTSGITQPPIAGFAIHQPVPAPSQDAAAPARCSNGLDRWHGWFYEHPRPRATGLVAVIHPWESRRQHHRLGRGLRARAHRRRRCPMSAQRPQACRPGDPPDQGAVRPLPVAGAALPLASAGIRS